MDKDLRKKILIMTSAFPRQQGEERDIFMLELCRRLAKEYEVTVLVPHDKGFPKQDAYDGLRIYKHSQSPFNSARIAYGSGILPNIRKNKWLLFAVPFYFLFQLHSLRRIVNKEKIALVNAHWILPQGLTAVLYKRFFNRHIKVVVTVHGTDLMGLSKGLMGRLQRYVFKHSNRIITVSQAMKVILDELGYGEKTKVRSMGIDTTQFSPEKKNPNIKKQYGISGPMLLFVGAVIVPKGIETLLRAMPEILKHAPDATLVVVGEGNLSSAMKQLAGDLGISNAVIFTGALPHSSLPELFATADVFVLPSHSEGFGLVVAEAMSSGTIVIATALPALCGLIETGNTGFLVPVQDINALAPQVVYVLQNRESLHAMRSNARKQVSMFYEWDVVAREYGSFFVEE